MNRRTQVFGPAYLDRVIHVDRPLLDPRKGPAPGSERRWRLEVRAVGVDGH